MEELVLTDPVVTPAKTTDTYRVVSLTLDLETTVTPGGQPGLIQIVLRDNHDERRTYHYVGNEAVSLIKHLNTANLSTKSMHKRILEKLSTDGIIPGTVTGTPDPPAAAE